MAKRRPTLIEHGIDAVTLQTVRPILNTICVNPWTRLIHLVFWRWRHKLNPLDCIFLEQLIKDVFWHPNCQRSKQLNSIDDRTVLLDDSFSFLKRILVKYNNPKHVLAINSPRSKFASRCNSRLVFRQNWADRIDVRLGSNFFKAFLKHRNKPRLLRNICKQSRS